MRYMRTLAACVLIPVFMSGCASTKGGPYSDRSWCTLGGAVAVPSQVRLSAMPAVPLWAFSLAV